MTLCYKRNSIAMRASQSRGFAIAIITLFKSLATGHARRARQSAIGIDLKTSDLKSAKHLHYSFDSKT